MAGLPDADQGRFPLPRLDPGGAAGTRPGAVHGPRRPVGHAGSAGVAVVLLQRTDDRAGPLSGARHFHPAHEDEEHSALDAGRGLDHASGTGVLRLGCWMHSTAWTFSLAISGGPPPQKVPTFADYSSRATVLQGQYS